MKNLVGQPISESKRRIEVKMINSRFRMAQKAPAGSKIHVNSERSVKM